MNPKAKMALIIGVPVLLVGAGVYIYVRNKNKSKGNTNTGGNTNNVTPPSPLGDAIMGTTTGNAQLRSANSNSAPLIDYVDADQIVFITQSKYNEGKWWYKISGVTTVSDDSQERTGWMSQDYLTL